ncbi:ATP-binding protein [Psychrobacter sp. HY3-MNA-CIBAN-0198]|uniref:ATP-binding protein n=1 Tax=Psychrobacter sp. HY3-MNA-CIBAN-0198 TaxID=3140441 RepID=UPI0033348423
MQNSNAVSLNEGIDQSVKSSNIFKNPVLSDRKKLKDNHGNENDIVYQAQTSKYHLDTDVILTTHTRNELEESLAKLKFHKVIYDDWGFSEVDKLGRSSILNFYGKPGTGKTLTAEAFAGRLDLPIIKVGIAEIESKLMGETSKNIQKVFQDAYEQNAVLFFDEADTLLGKRLSSVTQGVDNEINAMRSTMLIELEKFDGVVIFATNFAKNYDEAFRSRITYHVEFILPDLDTRKKLWSRMLVSKIPLADERDSLINQCAELSDGFSGREIRTCMRLALPKALMQSGVSIEEAMLSVDHLISAIENVRKSQREVGSSTDTSIRRKFAVQEAQIAKRMLGVKSPSLDDDKDSKIVNKDDI